MGHQETHINIVSAKIVHFHYNNRNTLVKYGEIIYLKRLLAATNMLTFNGRSISLKAILGKLMKDLYFRGQLSVKVQEICYIRLCLLRVAQGGLWHGSP